MPTTPEQREKMDVVELLATAIQTILGIVKLPKVVNDEVSSLLEMAQRKAKDDLA